MTKTSGVLTAERRAEIADALNLFGHCISRVQAAGISVIRDELFATIDAQALEIERLQRQLAQINGIAHVELDKTYGTLGDVNWQERCMAALDALIAVDPNRAATTSSRAEGEEG